MVRLEPVAAQEREVIIAARDVVEAAPGARSRATRRIFPLQCITSPVRGDNRVTL